MSASGRVGDLPPDVPWWPSRPVGRLEWLGLAAIVAFASLLRFVWLPTRGEFDTDQGRDMLTLWRLLNEGVVPLLGPPTSVGVGHHGALYYYLLAPAAALSGGRDPLPVVAFIAACGVLAVAVTWWVARALDGPVGGLLAALMLAVSASAVASSTFLWNPDLMPLSSGIAIAGAIQAVRTGHPGWWMLAAAGAAVTIQLHVLGLLIVPWLAVPYLAQVGRARGTDRRALLLAGIVSVAILALGYLPLLAHEAGTDFSEVRAMIAYVGSAKGGSAVAPLVRVLLMYVKIVAWPIVGPLDAAPPLAIAFAAVLPIAVVAVAWFAPRAERVALVWLLGGILGTALVLGLFVPGAVEITPLSVEQYHAWLDPVVAILTGLVLARALVGGRRAIASGTGIRSVFRVAGGVATLALVAWNLMNQPPAADPRGDWSSIRAGAERIATDAGAGATSTAFVGLPSFKGPDAFAFASTVAGRPPVDLASAETVGVVCDMRWIPDCARASRSWAASAAGVWDADPIDQFAATAYSVVTVYRRR